MDPQPRIGDRTGERVDAEATRENEEIPPLPSHWRTGTYGEDRGKGTTGRGEVVMHKTAQDVAGMKYRQMVVLWNMAVRWMISAVWTLMHLSDEFWHPNVSYPPQRYRLHLWYACLVLLNRPSKYVGYLESFFDDAWSLPSTLTTDGEAVANPGSDGVPIRRRNPHRFEDQMSSMTSSARPEPESTMTAEKGQELVERWNAEVIGRISEDWDRYMHLNIGIFVGCIASLQTPFISESPLLMGNLFLVVAFSGLGCLSGWNRSLLENMKNLKSMEQWEPLLHPSFDPAVIGNEFEFLALPEIYAVKAALLTCILVFQAPFSYFGYQVELGETPKLAFMVTWCIILGWGIISVIFGTWRMRTYSFRSRQC